MECVPNVSEGHNLMHVAALERAITSVPGVRLLDTHSDADHHRSVFTFVGPAMAVASAAIRLATLAVQLIDLRTHAGEHPRMGALDVLPFVPVHGSTLDDCAAMARIVAADLADRLEIPVFLYAHAARRPERRRLASVRGPGFERMLQTGLAAPATRPDFGPLAVHPSAGATAVGARDFLVAYNIMLDTADVTVAQRIAHRVRAASGGLPGVQALGFRVAGRAQVSMNLLDLASTPPRRAFAAVQSAAGTLGVEILRSEIVGLIPESATGPNDTVELRLDRPAQAHSFERVLTERARAI